MGSLEVETEYQELPNASLEVKTEHQELPNASLEVKTEYEELRNARILENKARMASLGIQKTIAELRARAQSAKRPWNKVDYFSAPLRCSNRLRGISPPPPSHPSPEALARRCTALKLCVRCHFCREKKLCGEEDCKRCGDLDMDQPCLGQTDCSICHSSSGIFCRRCLNSRYGEELSEVRANKEWICPHCTEEKGINPYWICNSRNCLEKRKMAPTERDTIYRARKMGYKSVAHLLMDQLKGAVEGR
ncbi:uncharacterized protein LOC132633178 isoform X2 [Lycium barbarum]|uniref:uncharacterized protein LOC132633178 isoform X2 n=1 Tax=Lycium barbarum TaxID=112863 RepID=UPI00293F5D98|nr:uncharacterized protein LOC132633178 isoform X2 [Lycium barbarum]